jgi:hypothetical protein
VGVALNVSIAIKVVFDFVVVGVVSLFVLSKESFTLSSWESFSTLFQ